MQYMALIAPIALEHAGAALNQTEQIIAAVFSQVWVVVLATGEVLQEWVEVLVT
jgi:hypothetical protein